MTFKVGDRVEWTSQAAGVTRTKVGTVIEVVPARANASNRRPSFGLRRDHESYVVRAVAQGRKSARPAYYWPRVSALRLAFDGGRK